jgi:hypothetical protein
VRTACCLLGLFIFPSFGCSMVGQGQLANQTLHPGPWPYQKRQATEFDPYSEQEKYGGPRDTTTRPRDYYEPIPEPDRARWVATQPWQTRTGTRW